MVNKKKAVLIFTGVVFLLSLTSATGAITDFDKIKKLSVASIAGNPPIARAVPLKIISGNDTTTGNGEIVLDWKNISSKSDIAVYDENDNLLDYYFESFDATNETAVIWVYRNWVRDGSIQAKVAYGNGPGDQSVAKENVFDKETDLAAGWLLNETSGDALDVTSNNNSGSVYGATQNVNGQVDKAYDFDGNNDYVEMNTPVSSVNSVTYTFWVNFTSSGRWDTGAGAKGKRFHLGYNKNQTEFLAGLGDNYKFISQDINTGQWHLFTLVGDNGTGRLYLNNAEVDTFSYNDGTPPNLFGIGKRITASWDENPVEGKIDNVRIHSSALSPDEINALYDATKSSPVFFEQKTPLNNGTIITDYATNIQSESAQLNGTLESLNGNSSMDVFFEWGNDTNYGDSTSMQTLSSTGSFNASLSGLSLGSTFHYRAVATDGSNTWYGDDVSFTTSITINDFNTTKYLIVLDASGSPVIARTVPLKITSGDETTSGTGEIVLDWTNIASKSDIAVYDENDNLLDYYFESFDATNETAVIWVYRNWVRDGSIQAKVAYGNGPGDQSVAKETVFDKETDLAGGWLLNETSGDALDVTSNNNNGTVHGATQDVAGQVDKAYDFDGNNDYVEMNTPVSSVNSVTYNFWVNFTNSDRWDTGSADDDKRFHLGYNKDSTEFLVGLGDNHKFISHNVSKDQWHFFTLVGDNGTGRLYFNGQEIGSFSYNDGTPNTSFGLGKRITPSWDENPVKGKIDNVRIHSSALSSQNINALYEASKSSPTFFYQTNQQDDAPLPVSWLSFSGERKTPTTIRLNWSTASEQNNDRFEIQRSTNGNVFDQIDTVTGAGNSNEITNYQFIDKNAPENILYYRLKQVDYDGKYDYSEIITISAESNMAMNELSVSPNPVQENMTVQLPDYSGKITVEIYDMSGNIVYNKTIKNKNRFSVKTAQWPNGVYMILCRSNHLVLRQKIIKN